MGDRAYVEIVCREEDEPLFEALGFMQEFHHALPANVVWWMQKHPKGPRPNFRLSPRKASYSVSGTMPVEAMTELASPVPAESTTRCRGSIIATCLVSKS